MRYGVGDKFYVTLIGTFEGTYGDKKLWSFDDMETRYYGLDDNQMLHHILAGSIHDIQRWPGGEPAVGDTFTDLDGLVWIHMSPIGAATESATWMSINGEYLTWVELITRHDQEADAVGGQNRFGFYREAVPEIRPVVGQGGGGRDA